MLPDSIYRRDRHHGPTHCSRTRCPWIRHSGAYTVVSRSSVNHPQSRLHISDLVGGPGNETRAARSLLRLFLQINKDGRLVVQDPPLAGLHLPPTEVPPCFSAYSWRRAQGEIDRALGGSGPGSRRKTTSSVICRAASLHLQSRNRNSQGRSTSCRASNCRNSFRTHQ